MIIIIVITRSRIEIVSYMKTYIKLLITCEGCKQAQRDYKTVHHWV